MRAETGSQWKCFKRGAELDHNLEHVTTRASVLWILCMQDKILNWDAKQTGIGIVQPGRNEKAGDKIGCAFTQKFDLGCKGNSGAWDVDWAERWECFQPLAGTQ